MTEILWKIPNVTIKPLVSHDSEGVQKIANEQRRMAEVRNLEAWEGNLPLGNSDMLSIWASIDDLQSKKNELSKMTYAKSHKNELNQKRIAILDRWSENLLQLTLKNKIHKLLSDKIKQSDARLNQMQKIITDYQVATKDRKNATLWWLWVVLHIDTEYLSLRAQEPSAQDESMRLQIEIEEDRVNLESVEKNMKDLGEKILMLRLLYIRLTREIGDRKSIII